MEISISSVTAVYISEVERDTVDDEDDEFEEPFHRTLTIRTKSGTLEIELDAATREALELVEEDE